MPRILQLAIIGTAAGVFCGVFGVGGGIVIVPLLVLWLGYGEREATGTSLAAAERRGAARPAVDRGKPLRRRDRQRRERAHARGDVRLARAVRRLPAGAAGVLCERTGGSVRNHRLTVRATDGAGNRSAARRAVFGIVR
jgi:hypothetical protein